MSSESRRPNIRTSNKASSHCQTLRRFVPSATVNHTSLLLLLVLIWFPYAKCWQPALAPLARLRTKLAPSNSDKKQGGLFGPPLTSGVHTTKRSSLHDRPNGNADIDANNKKRRKTGKRERLKHQVSSMWSTVRLKERQNNNGKDVTVLDANMPMEEVVEELETENKLLRETIRQLEIENDRLHSKQRVVLESFEGESWYSQDKNKYDDEGISSGGEELMDWGITLTEAEMANDYTPLNDESAAMWCDELEDGACPVEPTTSFGEALRDRAYWLVGLLAMQSCSGIILSHNEALLANHPIIIYFLTMLVGAGGASSEVDYCYFSSCNTLSSLFILLSLHIFSSIGNAGNQASVRGKATFSVIVFYLHNFSSMLTIHLFAIQIPISHSRDCPGHIE